MADSTANDDVAPDTTPGFKPPAMKTLDEIRGQDNDDESLVKYKQVLLGTAASGTMEKPRPNDSRNVILNEFSILVDGRPDITLNLEGDLSKLKDQPVIMKEGTMFKVRIRFFVQNEIVSGLKYFQVLYRKGIRVDKDTSMVGSYGPKPMAQEFTTKPDEAPKGMMYRGMYNVKSKFIDDDKNVILEWEWPFKICKDWTSAATDDE
ncbi:rho GDP-dissociation inhibitor 2-like [Tubulanus polymorphus]|uniref:rho GDP-dissociation inhibitor 2-like n=1 Tax=Tubulanus polymorphus TaxID=672921 RepID=UPI003DA6AC5A